MDENEYFTVSFFKEDMKKILGIYGSKSGRDMDKMHFDFAIEDSPTAFGFFKHLPDLKVMVYDRPWNRECEFPGDNYVRCFDWNTIRKAI